MNTIKRVKFYDHFKGSLCLKIEKFCMLHLGFLSQIIQFRQKIQFRK